MKLRFLIVGLLAALVLLAGCSMSVDVPEEEGNAADIETALVESLTMTDFDDSGSRSSIGGLIFPIAVFLEQDATLSSLGSDDVIPLAGTYEGKSEVLGYFSDLLRSVRVRKTEVQAVLIEDSYMNFHLRLEGKVRSSKNTFDIEFVWAMELGDHGIASIDIYYDTYSWYEAFNTEGRVHISDIKSLEPAAWNPWDETDYIPTVDLGYEAFYFTGDIPTVLSILHPELYWVFKGNPDLNPYAGLYYGIDGFLQFAMNIAPAFVLQNIEFHTFVQHGNMVDVTFTEAGYSVSTGKTYEIDVMHTFIFEDGLIKEYKTYNDGYAVAESYRPD